ncbi:hypothetical protein BTVI_130255 [Pitangus sulphuratus]|nr:hypothetical protein BTVI_130255 [Pitangus sulphuratus]
MLYPGNAVLDPSVGQVSAHKQSWMFNVPQLENQLPQAQNVFASMSLYVQDKSRVPEVTEWRFEKNLSENDHSGDLNTERMACETGTSLQVAKDPVYP